MNQIAEWKAQEVAEYLAYIERVAEKIAAWRKEYGYVKMCTLVDFQKIGQIWKGLSQAPEARRRAKVEEMVDSHFETLQRKVEGKIGKILKIYPTGNNGADYYFEGENGNIEIRVIAAGGYNIQCAHTRWIFIK